MGIKYTGAKRPVPISYRYGTRLCEQMESMLKFLFILIIVYEILIEAFDLISVFGRNAEIMVNHEFYIFSP